MSSFAEQICAIALCDKDVLDKIIRDDSQEIAIEWVDSSECNIDKRTISIKISFAHMDRNTFIKRYIHLYGSHQYYTTKFSLEKQHA